MPLIEPGIQKACYYFLTLLGAIYTLGMFWTKKKWSPKGQNCYVTGGSQGCGLALAILLAKKGANVTIVARDEKKLNAALQEIERNRQSPEQVFRSHSFSLDTASGSATAIEAECAANGGRAPDAFFFCAGSSKPYFWVESTPEDLTQGMNQAYWVQAWSAHSASKKLVEQNRPGKIVFVSSTLALMSFVGWSSYAPGKTALKGLAESLRSELLMYGISVHIFFAPTMDTPGYEVEMTTKPPITKKIEEDDVPLSVEQAAAVLLRGVEEGHHHINSNLITSIFRASTRGSAPSPNVFIDIVLDNIAWIATPIWRRLTDSKILAHRHEHRKYLETRGFFANANNA